MEQDQQHYYCVWSIHTPDSVTCKLGNLCQRSSRDLCFSCAIDRQSQGRTRKAAGDNILVMLLSASMRDRRLLASKRNDTRHPLYPQTPLCIHQYSPTRCSITPVFSWHGTVKKKKSQQMIHQTAAQITISRMRRVQRKQSPCSPERTASP